VKDLDAELREYEEKLGLRKEQPVRRDRPCVMVVDDDPGFLKSLVDTLNGDYEVIACASGREALEKLIEKVCTVILDIKMPGMNGFEVMRQIKNRARNLPVIFNTGYPGEYIESRIEADYEPFGYVTKDKPQVLLAHLKSAIKHFNLTRNYLDLIKNLERQVEERTEQNKLLLLELSELDKLKFTQHLLAKARHELNNPLTVLASAIGRIDRAYQDYKAGVSGGEQVLGRESGLTKQWDQTIIEIEKVYNILETLKPFESNLGSYRQSIADALDRRAFDKDSLKSLGESLKLLSTETGHLGERVESSIMAMTNFRKSLDGFEKVVLSEGSTGLPSSLEEELNSGIVAIKNEIGNMAGVINTLSEFAKTGKYTQGKERIDLKSFMEQYEIRYKTRFEELGIDFKVLAEKPFYVKADSTQLYEVFDNLINNSIEANAKKIEVRIYEKELTGGVIYNEVQMKDGGKGFKMEDKESIFLPFSSTKGGKLSGIGLGVVKSIVSTNKGFVDCEGKPGEGASFYITLPQYEKQG
jgi:signal transduction histidine kinase